MKKIIEVKNLTKNYGNLAAVNNVCFEVQKGEVFGLLGENGAGKTTTLEIIEGLRQATSGKVKILGLDFRKNQAKIKQKIGVQLQSSAYYNFLKLKEILDLFASFYDKKIETDKLFEIVGLKSKANQYVSALSGGQKQRFSIIASLINDPEIVFLDEPTTGLDPVARRNTWEIISKIKEQGKTIVLTTHYLEEAEFLCDRVAIMEKGKIIAMDKPHKLIEKTKNPFRITFILAKDDPEFIDKLRKTCELADCDIKKLPGKTGHYEIHLKSQAALNQALMMVETKKPESLKVGQATLEDLFIELTGKTITNEEQVNV